MNINNEIFDMPVPDYLPGFTSPCWIECFPVNRSQVYPSNPRFSNPGYRTSLDMSKKRVQEPSLRNVNWRLRCLPQFYLIGMPKCGTTDLFTRIISHPDIRMIGGKELNWWSHMRLLLSENEVYSLERYLDVADIGAEAVMEYVRINSTSGKPYHYITYGDGTPSTMWYSKGWNRYQMNEGLEEPAVWTPHVMHHIQPQAKLIVTLRDPTTMTYSAYRFFNKTELKTPDRFHKCVTESITLHEMCLQTHSERRCAFMILDGFREQGNIFNTACRMELRSLILGHYYIFLQMWMEKFDRQQFFITRLEDYAVNRADTILNIWKFLGIDWVPWSKRLPLYEHHMANHNDHGPSKPMNTETLLLMKQYFKRSNEKLAALLNDKAYLWH